jgi:hypothetical protein
MASIRRLRSLPKSSRHDCYQDGRYQDLGSEGKPETPLRCITDHGPSSTADNADQDGDETPNGLHTRNQDSSDESNYYSNKKAAEKAGDLHGSTQPLQSPIGQVRRAGKVHENTFFGNHP